MGKFRKQLSKDWLKYGFETFAVLVGVLGAFALDNWKDKLKERQMEKEYIQNLTSDVNRQLSIITDQISFESVQKSTCEDIIRLLNTDPIDLDEFRNLASKLTRKTFIVYDPVFEDLKYSGHLSLLSDSKQKNELLGFYQMAEYVEQVIRSNNETYVDPFTIYLGDSGLADFGTPGDSLNVVNVSVYLDSESHAGSEQIIAGHFQDKDLVFRLHNRLAGRGITSSVHVDLLNRLYGEGESINELLSE